LLAPAVAASAFTNGDHLIYMIRTQAQRSASAGFEIRFHRH
jgi:hypothetical protein